jgi:predicted SprT family Zn-dependent metalloprotease
MNYIGKPEITTQKRVIKVFENELGYKYLGDWHRREANNNIEEDFLKSFGSCSHNKKTIRLNLELAKKPPECLEYIIVHELLHLIEPSSQRQLFFNLTTIKN